MGGLGAQKRPVEGRHDMIFFCIWRSGPGVFAGILLPPVPVDGKGVVDDGWRGRFTLTLYTPINLLAFLHRYSHFLTLSLL